MSDKRASYEIAEFKADTREGHRGEFEAIVSVFNNVDKIGDRVMPGAFKNTLAAYEKSGDPIPVIWSHDWADPYAHIGKATAVETDKGLKVSAKLDIEDNPMAAQVFKLLSERRVKEFSFGYHINKEQIAEDKANELLDLDLLEVGPTLKGMNPATELLATKAAEEDFASNIADATTVHEALEQVGTVTVSYQKAGARLSAATQSEMQSIHDGMNELTSRMRALMGSAEDAPKSQTDDMPPAKSDSEAEQPDETTTDDMPPAPSVDDESLALILSVEEALLSGSKP